MTTASPGDKIRGVIAAGRAAGKAPGDILMDALRLAEALGEPIDRGELWGAIVDRTGDDPDPFRFCPSPHPLVVPSELRSPDFPALLRCIARDLIEAGTPPGNVLLELNYWNLNAAHPVASVLDLVREFVPGWDGRLPRREHHATTATR